MMSPLAADPAFTWEDDRPLNNPWNRTVIYECHVKGMTMRHPAVPEHLRGTYLTSREVARAMLEQRLPDLRFSAHGLRS